MRLHPSPATRISVVALALAVLAALLTTLLTTLLGTVPASSASVATAKPAHARQGRIVIRVLSNRADLVSGGDVLLAVKRPARSGPLRVALN